MVKVFEDYFSELQADMISICLEYVENKADKIYIYCSYEHNSYIGSCFFNINNFILDRHELNKGAANQSFTYDTSVERQRMLLRIINEDIEKIFDLCKEYGKPMPTEMKIIYDVKKNSMKAEFKYDLVYSNKKDTSAMDICDKWFEEIKAQVEA
jgi:hypothetical protein